MPSLHPSFLKLSQLLSLHRFVAIHGLLSMSLAAHHRKFKNPRDPFQQNTNPHLILISQTQTHETSPWCTDQVSPTPASKDVYQISIRSSRRRQPDFTLPSVVFHYRSTAALICRPFCRCDLESEACTESPSPWSDPLLHFDCSS